MIRTIAAAVAFALTIVAGVQAQERPSGADGVKRFRASGVAMGLSAEGVTGRAALKGGGRYEDVYVRMPQGGWRFKSRLYVPDDAQ